MNSRMPSMFDNENLARVRGKTVILMGSAPVFNLFRASDYDFVASVNGSHKAYGITSVDFLFLNSYSLMGNNTVRNRIIDSLENLSCGTCVLIDAANAGADHPVSSADTVFVSKSDRNSALAEITGEQFGPEAGGRNVPSTGIFAALILRHLGANVTLTGFSLSDGHSLDGAAKRQHVDMDQRFMRGFCDLSHPRCETA